MHPTLAVQNQVRVSYVVVCAVVVCWMVVFARYTMLQAPTHVLMRYLRTGVFACCRVCGVAVIVVAVFVRCWFVVLLLIVCGVERVCLRCVYCWLRDCLSCVFVCVVCVGVSVLCRRVLCCYGVLLCWVAGRVFV